MFIVFLLYLWVDDDIIKVSGGEFIEEFMECMVNKVLKGSWGVLEAEGHDKVFIEVISCDKGGFPFFSCSHLEPIESSNDVKLCVVLSFMKGV